MRHILEAVDAENMRLAVERILQRELEVKVGLAQKTFHLPWWAGTSPGLAEIARMGVPCRPFRCWNERRLIGF